MSYCISPKCTQRKNDDTSERCLNCGTELLIAHRFRLLKPLRPLDYRYSTEIFEAVDDKGTRKVMKVLRSQRAKEISLLERETLTLQLFNHPGIPRVVDDLFTVTPNNSSTELHCLVMQKFEGLNLEQWVKANGKISQVLALNWLIQIVKILDEVHRSGFFHRDIKPSNIIVQPDGQLGLIDFGAVREVTRSYLAKVSGSGGNDMGLGQHEITVLVTAGFTPLEQINGQAVPQSDFYALGRTLAYLVTGIHVTNLLTDPQTTRLIWRNKARHIEKPFADLLDDLMAPAPGKRPPSTQILLQRLEDLPFKLKFNQILTSKRFIISLAILTVPIAITSYQGLSLAISNYYFNLASRNINEPKIARKYYEQVIRYNQKDAAAYNNLALVCQRLLDIKCVTENYEKAFKLRPNSWESHYGLGNFYEDQQKYDLAEKEYQLAIQKSDYAVLAVAALSRLKNNNNQHEAAVILALQGLKKTKDPEIEAALYKDLGWARFKQNKLIEAKKHLEKSIRLDGRTDAFCLLSQVEEALGDTDTARIYIEGCMLAKSTLPEVFNWRQKLLDRILKK
ncbi:serine/threonine-protein kinase [Nostoc sphaeroides CHAB 2801]|uniref:protein kinase domain-containing protein n=1 Tax=Nostoc sphaeroides TaxID=446679 RepID=UPI001E2E65E1|nr:serine/threonine-protein kinase [Nostoc sphaeroides]MCC5611211.1 serine/threonine-protein kinase [Nostoc sp. CHAB 5834]MCC5633900.1 serine/threonine-protein kinase [Nostoc sphaeroides CHAB 2801]